MTTSQSAGPGLQSAIKRGSTHTASKAPTYWGADAPALGPEFFTNRRQMSRNMAMACVLMLLLSGGGAAVAQVGNSEAVAQAGSRMTSAKAGRVPAETLRLQVGEVKVLGQPDVARVAVGDGHVMNAVVTEEKEVIVFARNAGTTSLHLWSDDGRQRRFDVMVEPEGARQQEEELSQMLARIPGVRMDRVGDKLIAEGATLSDADRERLAVLAGRYPQLLDFTSQVGWDDMVLLDVQVVEVPRTRLRDLGVRWNGVSEGGLNAGLAWDAGSRALPDRPGSVPVPAVFPAASAMGYFGANALLSSQIDLLAQTGEALVLAQPQLLARSGATAEFLAGGEVPYSTTDGNGNSSTAFKPYGVSLRITPRIERNGAVRSRIEVEVSSIDPSLSVPNGPSLKTRRAATEFNVQSGQTLVLAGFISREESRNIDKVPGLGDVPLLGALFRSERYRRNETELAVFVTPAVIRPEHPDMTRRVLQGQALLEQTFPDAARLNTPIRGQALPLPPDALQADGVRHDAAGMPWFWHGHGSQWQPASMTQASDGSPGVATDAGAAMAAGRQANQYDFVD